MFVELISKINILEIKVFDIPYFSIADLKRISMMLFKNFKSQRLTKLIKEERRKLKSFRFGETLRDTLSEIYIPSWKSLLAVILFILLIYFGGVLIFYSLRNFCFLNIPEDLIRGENEQNWIAIHAGIGTIIFALVIFVAESLRSEDTEKARVLLKESYLFPLAVGEILVFFSFIWGEINVFVGILVLIIGVFAIVSLYKIISILLNKYKFAQKKSQVLTQRLRQSIDLAIDERIGNNILLSRLNDNDIKLKFNPLFATETDNYFCLTTEKVGVIFDVDLNALRQIADFIDSEGRENNYSFSGTEKPGINVGEEGEAEEIETACLPKNDARYLLKHFHDVVNEENKILICLDKRLVKEQKKLERIQPLVERAFIIRPSDNFNEEISYELLGIKDQFISAINQRQLRKIQELAELYKKLADEFLENVSRFGGGFTSSQALIERSSLLGGWEQVQWLRNDVRDLIEKSIKSEDREIIQKIVYLPMAIAIRSNKKDDHYLFQEFVVFSEMLYASALSEKNEGIRNLLKDRSWRYLQDISYFYVEPKIQKGFLKSNGLEEVKGYGIFLLKVFQNLHKTAIERNDFEGIKNFKSAALKLFDRFSLSEDVYEIEDLESKIEALEESSEERRVLKGKLEGRLLLKEFDSRRKQMFFGLSSWLLSETLSGKNNLKEYYDLLAVAVSDDIVELTNIFSKCHSFETIDFWNWGWWERGSEGEVYSVQMPRKLETFYAIKGLSLLSTKKQDEIQRIKLPLNRELAYLAGGSRSLVNILDDIGLNPGKWNSILSQEAIGKVESFKGLLCRVKEEQEKKDAENKRSKPISKTKVDEFRAAFLSAFSQAAIIRSIFQYYQLIDNQPERPVNGMARIGINIVEDKAALFDEWHVHFGNFGGNWGRDIASFENFVLLEKIIEGCQEILEDEFDAKLKDAGNYDEIFILASKISIWRFFDQRDGFQPKWDESVKELKVNGFIGWYYIANNKIPVFEAHHRSIGSFLLILNKKSLGKIIQLSPLAQGDNKESQIQGFFWDIQDFSENEEKMEEFISSPLEWLNEIGDEEKKREYLQERVHVQIFERFEFKRSDKFIGYKIVLDS